MSQVGRLGNSPIPAIREKAWQTWQNAGAVGTRGTTETRARVKAEQMFQQGVNRFQFALRVIVTGSKAELSAPIELQKDKEVIPILYPVYPPNIIKVRCGEHEVYLGGREDLLGDRRLLESRLRQFISDPVKYIKKVELRYKEALMYIETLRMQTYEDDARQEGRQIGIPDDQVEADIVIAKQKA